MAIAAALLTEGALRRVATGLDLVELDGGDGGGIVPLIAGAAALDTEADFSLRDRGITRNCGK